MIASAHLLGGLICGLAALPVRAAALRVAVAFGLGVASHVMLDMIPHSDYATLSRSTIIVVVSMEIAATLGLAWVLLRRPRVRGWRTTLPAGLAGASIPDVKFFAPFLPSSMATRIEEVANRFHGPFHAPPMALTLELSAELGCTVLLLGAFVFLARHPPGQHSARYQAAPHE